MPRSPDPAARAAFDASLDAIVGRRLDDVTYYDVPGSAAAERWDHGDWHHVVTGVELTTDGGPVSLAWADTFNPYGIEPFHAPMPGLRSFGPDPDGRSVRDHPLWRRRLGSPVRAATAWWDHLTIGPARRNGDGAVVADAYDVDVPYGLRLDLDAGPVWIVNAIPDPPDMASVFVGGDELMVVFSRERMRWIGFPDDGFLA